MKAVFFVSERNNYLTFIDFIKNSGLSIQIKILSSFSVLTANSATFIFVDEKTASLQQQNLAKFKKNNNRFLFLFLIAGQNELNAKSIPDYFDDVITIPFSKDEWGRRLKSYLRLAANEKSEINREEEYDSLFANSHSIMLLINSDTGHIAEANKAACKFYGYSHIELTSMKIQEINQLDNKIIFAEMEKARCNKKNFFIYKHRLADGSIKTVEVHSGNITRHNKSYLFSIIYDITDRINAEKQLTESLENYRRVIENAPDIVVLTDKNGIIRFVNQRIKEFGDYSEKDIVGKLITDFLPLEDHQEAFAAIKRVFENKQNEPYFSSSLILKDGKKIPVITKGTPVRFGSEILNMTVIRDISFIKEAEARLQQSKKTFEDIFNNHSVAIYMQDSSGKFIDINRAALKQYGFTNKNELVGKMPEFVAAEGKNDFVQIKKYLTKAFKGEPQQFEFWAKRKDGSIFPKLVVVEKGTYFGKPVVYNFSFDITERKKMEKAYQESEEMLNSIFNSAPSPANLINKKFEVVLSNKSLLNLRGVSMEEVAGKKCYEVYHNRPNICAHCAAKQVFHTRKPVGSENALTLPNGKIHYFNTLAYPIFDSQKKIKYVVESTVDITEKKRIQLQLQQSESKYHHLFQYMDNCVAVYTVNTENEIVIKEFNRAAEKLEKVNHDEVVGKKLKDIFSGAEEFGICRAIRNVFITGKPSNLPVTWYQNNRVKGWREHYLYKLPSGEVVAIYNDVTKEKMAEEALRESQQLFKTLANNSPTGIFRTDKNGNTTYVNPKWSEITSCSFEEAKGKGWQKYLHPEDRKRSVKKWRKSVEAQETSNERFRIIRSDGSLRWVLGYAVPEVVDGELKGYVGTITDITNLILTEKALRESELKYREQFKLFRLMSDDIPILVWAKDLEGRFMFVNKATCNKLLIARDIEQPIGKNDMFFALRQRRQHPERDDWFTFGETCINSDAVVLKSKKPQRFDEYGYVQGKFLFLDVYKAPIFDENGKILGTVGYGMDVTKEKEAEKELLLRDKALNAAANAIVITDANGVLEWVNEAFTKLSGYTKNEALGKYTTDLIGSGKQSKVFYENLNNTLWSGKVWVGEFIDKRKDGTLYEVEEIITPVTNEAGEVEHLIGIMNDIAERKANERELQAAKQAAEESSRLKSAFLANMNHEIRTPMNAIMGFSELMLGATPEDKENYANIVNSSSTQLLKLIDDIIFLSRLQSEKLPVKNIPFNPKAVVEQIFNMFNIPDMKKNLRLETEFDVEVSKLLVNADVDKTKQVLTNLISNAIKYTKTGYVKMGVFKKQNNIVYFVEDSGMGISKEEQKRVFDSFFRGKMAVKDAIRGTGLGLNIAKELVELMNGKIGVSSQIGVGSRFFFSIPYKKASSNNTKKTSSLYDAKKWNELNILIAEDDDNNYLYLEVLLQNIVKRLDRAEDGLKALELTKKNKYDLILMDIKMPVMSGEKATKEIKKLFPKIPIIATTANVSPEERESALKAGCDDYLSKPIKKTDLMAIIDQYISNK